MGVSHISFTKQTREIKSFGRQKFSSEIGQSERMLIISKFSVFLLSENILLSDLLIKQWSGNFSTTKPRHNIFFKSIIICASKQRECFVCTWIPFDISLIFYVNLFFHKRWQINIDKRWMKHALTWKHGQNSEFYHLPNPISCIIFVLMVNKRGLL